jgi:site-specific recombinase XerD
LKEREAPVGQSLAEAVADYLHFHKNKGSSPGTIREYAYVLDDRTPTRAKWLPLLSWCARRGVTTVGQLDKDECQIWLDDMKEKAAPSSWSRAVVVLKRFLSWCVEEEYLERPPLRLTEPKRKETEIAVFSLEEMSRIAKVVQRENIRDWAIFMLLVDTGLRCQELVNLTLDDLRLDRKEISVVRKGGKRQIVPLKASPGPLKAWLRERPDFEDCPWVFLSFAGTPVYGGGKGNLKRTTTKRSLKSYCCPAPLTRVGLYQLCVKWGRLAEVTEARNSPHTYRHYFAVNYLRNTGDVFTLKEILGHTKLEMTIRYARMAQVDVKRVHAIASPAQRFLPIRSQRMGEE